MLKARLKARLAINFQAVLVYSFGFALTYLAGFSLAGNLQFIFFLYLLYPVVSFVLLVSLFFNFRYYENFSTEHPAKGDEVSYILNLANEALYPAFVKVKFKLISPDTSFQIAPLALFLKPKASLSHTYRLRFPYRGIYKVGLEEIELTDYLGWLRYRPPVWFRTFYVYPRLIELQGFVPAQQNICESSGVHEGILYDYSLYQELREYRPGANCKHLAWKKFGATGMPYIKEYEKNSWPGVTIYLDLRRESEANPGLLEREDCSVEILVALVKYFLDRRTPVRVVAYNERDRFCFAAQDPQLFKGFYTSTINLNFSGSVSAVQIFELERREHLLATGSVIFITHQFDLTYLELVTSSICHELNIIVIVNESGLSPSICEKQQQMLTSQTKLKAKILFVKSSSSLLEDLSQ